MTIPKSLNSESESQLSRELLGVLTRGILLIVLVAFAPGALAHRTECEKALFAVQERVGESIRTESFADLVDQADEADGHSRGAESVSETGNESGGHRLGGN